MVKKDRIIEAQKITGMFKDLPLSRGETHLFVDRFDELNMIRNIGLLLDESIYGVAGETGSGKTTLFNILDFEEDPIHKIILHITEKDSKEIIIADLLDKLCLAIRENKHLSFAHKEAEEIISFLKEEELKGQEKGVKVGKIIEGEKKWTRTSKERFNLSAIKGKLREMVKTMVKYDKVLCCIDEIDKETKKDVLVILDSLKDELIHKNLVVVIALPQLMYHQYVQDRIGLLKEGNLENILKDIVPLHRMNDEDIDSLLIRRTRKFPDILSSKVRQLVVEFAAGNPREALLLCLNSLLKKKLRYPYEKDDFVLREEEIKNEMERFVKARISGLKLSKRERQILKVASDQSILTRSEIFRRSSQIYGIPSSTIQTVVKSLLAKKIVKEVESDTYEIDKKIGLFFKYYDDSLPGAKTAKTVKTAKTAKAKKLRK